MALLPAAASLPASSIYTGPRHFTHIADPATTLQTHFTSLQAETADLVAAEL